MSGNSGRYITSNFKNIRSRIYAPEYHTKREKIGTPGPGSYPAQSSFENT